MQQTIVIALLIGQLALIVGLIVLNVKTSKKNKKINRILTKYKERLREDELDASIRNERHKENKAENDWTFTPYEVSYMDEQEVRSTEAVCVHLQCVGRLATKKYLINIKDELYVGGDKTNGVVLDEYDVAQKHIHFLKQGKLLFAQNISNGVPVNLIRGKSRHPLTDVLVQVNDGDMIEFLTSQILINLI